MKIAIAATSAEADAEVSPRAARAPCYFLFDEQGERLDVLSNPFLQVDRGAAPRAALFLADNEVELLVAVEFGPRFSSELEQRGIQHLQKSGQVSEVIRELITEHAPS